MALVRSGSQPRLVEQAKGATLSLGGHCAASQREGVVQATADHQNIEYGSSVC